MTFSPEICVKKVNELSRYQMIWTDEDGFLLKPLGNELKMQFYALSICQTNLISLFCCLQSLQS